MYIYTFKPTYLYVKRHKITGKLYFGKTQRDPEKYLGSGSHWKPHIKKHGIEHVETLWYCLFLDKESIIEFATMFSIQQNIVESEDWLNQINETGIDGYVNGYTHSKETRDKISTLARGRKLSEKHRDALLASNIGKAKTAEARKKISDSRKGKTLSNESKAKISSKLTGRKRGPISDETKMKKSIAMKGRHHEIVVCPYCSKTGGRNNMLRWHFDNCCSKNIAS